MSGTIEQQPRQINVPGGEERSGRPIIARGLFRASGAIARADATSCECKQEDDSLSESAQHRIPYYRRRSEASGKHSISCTQRKRERSTSRVLMSGINFYGTLELPLPPSGDKRRAAITRRTPQMIPPSSFLLIAPRFPYKSSFVRKFLLVSPDFIHFFPNVAGEVGAVNLITRYRGFVISRMWISQS